MKKTPLIHDFLNKNDITTFIETGCTENTPKTGDTEYKIVNNNGVKSTKRRIQNVYCGKGTA